MKAIAIKEFCNSLDGIQVSETPRPQPKPDEILIQVAAAGVNFVDILYAQGKHQNNKHLVRPPFTLGLEFAGIVVSSPATSSFKPGDAVFGDCLGSYGEFVVIAEASGSLQMMPSSWDFAEAAALGATLPVSYGALVLRGGLKARETVLVHSAAGGIGAMATQIAVAMGCRVLGTAGSAEKCAYAQSLGASKCVNYSQGNWWEEILKETDGLGVDVVFDPVGLVDRSLKCLAHRGRVLVVGFAGLEGQMEKIAMNRVLLKQATLIGYRYGESLRRDPDERRRIWDELRPLIESDQIRPTVSHCYPGLDKVPQALMDLLNRKISGKAVIKVSAGLTDPSKPRL
ncbi:zeta-crystallin [Dactylonectria estremocensis]|uniref:Zeta-crystallin n=1 Tax=Dactylonectria estremocensis TaxID=1079267 RepID=A0A9P9IZW6_9HYPO|nr:zeta-crystallin [Dactylonectria estremocensis]